MTYDVDAKKSFGYTGRDERDAAAVPLLTSKNAYSEREITESLDTIKRNNYQLDSFVRIDYILDFSVVKWNFMRIKTS